MKRYLSLFLITLMIVASFTGCGGSKDNDSGGGEGVTDVLYHSISSEPYITLDPSAENSNGIYILQNVYETLTRYNSETNEIEPLLATEWTQNADGTVWEFKLREGV
ncbi:MAG: ABC transporter substrate-binding protein, partial [Firmicutes bacterium HGW-Firmicutes-18]